MEAPTEFETGPQPMSPRVRAVVVEDTPSVLVLFDNGEARRVDLSEAAARPRFSALADAEERSRVRVHPYGHAVEWACGYDASAGSLYRQGEPVRVAHPEPAAS